MWQAGQERGLGENGYMYMCGWVSLLSTWNYQSILNQLSVSSVVQSVQLPPHGLQYAKLLCPSPTPGVNSNLCPLSRWCHPTTSSSGVPFSSHPQSFPASRSFQMSQFFALLWWPKYWSFSFSISSSNKYSGLISSRIDWLDPLAVQGTLKPTLTCYTPIQNKKFKKRMGMFEEERAEKSELQWRERKPQKLWAGWGVWLVKTMRNLGSGFKHGRGVI